MTYDENTFIVVVTHSHSIDTEIVAHCAKQSFAYLGMIASRRKAQEIKEKLVSQNILSNEEYQRIDTPIGVPIACETPAEIAISILAKIIDVRNRNK